MFENDVIILQNLVINLLYGMWNILQAPTRDVVIEVDGGAFFVRWSECPV